MRVVLDALKDEFDLDKHINTLDPSTEGRLRGEFRVAINDALRESVQRTRLDISSEDRKSRQRTKFLLGFHDRQEPVIRMLTAEGAEPHSPGPDGTAREIAERSGADAALRAFDEYDRRRGS